MPRSRILFDRIPQRVGLAAALDQFLLDCRRSDDSYGATDDEVSRVTLSLAVLQAHIEKGLSLESPRLQQTAAWLRQCDVSRPQVMIAPLRLAASLAIGTPADSLQNDIASTIGLLAELNKSPALEKPVLAMLSTEVLADCGIGRKNEVFGCAVDRLENVIASETESPSVRAYAGALLQAHGTREQKKDALSGFRRLLSLQEEGSWRGCMVETSYVVLNLATLQSNNQIRDAIALAQDFIQRQCPSGIPRQDAIMITPKELGADKRDLAAYSASVCIRALLQGSDPRPLACLKFAHAAWKRQVELTESKLADLEAFQKGGVPEVQSRLETAVRNMSIAAGVSLILLLLLSILNPKGVSLVIGITGSLASIIALCIGLRRRK